MKLKLFILLFSYFITLPLWAFIHDKQSAHIYSSLHLYSDQFHYEEFENDETLMSEKGPFKGLQLSYQFPLTSTWLFKLEAINLKGKTTYNGGLQSLASNEVIPYSFNNISQTRHSYAAYLAKRMSLSSHHSFITFTGIFYRRWVDRSDLASIYGYKRVTRYFTIPIGIHYQYAVNNSLTMGASTSYHVWINGKNTSGLGRFGDTTIAIDGSNYTIHRRDLTFNQNKGTGFQGALFLRYQFKNSPFMLDVTFNYIQWLVEDSDTQGLYVTNQEQNSRYFVSDLYLEPENISTQKGIAIGLHCQF